MRALAATVALLLLAATVGAGEAPGTVVLGADSGAPAESLGPLTRLVRLSVTEVCEGAAGAAAAGKVALVLSPPSAPQEPCWLAGTAALAQDRAGSGPAYLVEAQRDALPSGYAYLLKRASIALRAADPGATIVAGPLPGVEGWLDGLVQAGAAPYIDALAASPAALDRLLQDRDRLLPGIPVWLVEPSTEAAGDREPLLRAAAALRRGAEGALVHVRDARELLDFVALAESLPDGALPASSPSLHVRQGVDPGVVEFIGGADGAERVLVVPPSTETLGIEVGLPPARRADLIDPASGKTVSLLLRRHDDGTAGVELRPRAVTMLLRVLPRGDIAGETVEVGRQRGLTAAEIIARERAARARQELALDHFQAHARIGYHFSLSNLGESVDVVTENEVFGRGDAVEYRQTAMFVNGTRWRGKPPAFPFVATEKVTEVPLRVALSEAYRYTLEGEEEQGGASCYRIAFEPMSGDEAPFRGTVWIDRETFLRVRLDLVRLRPSAPVTSDVMTQWFESVPAEGRTFHLMTRVEGQMIFSALGRNAILERKVHLDDFRVNRPAFEEDRRAAMSSDDPMYRDSLEGGLETLVPGGEGERTARSATTKANTLVVAGMGGSVDGDVGAPFVAANWFDLDFRGTGTQLDLAWAGPFVGLSLTWPELGQSRWEATFESRILLVGRADKYTDSIEGRRDSQDVEQREELATFFIRRPLGPSVTFALQPGVIWTDFKRDSNTDDDFVLPPTTWIPQLGLRLDIDHGGYQLGFAVEGEHRLDWGPFGREDLTPLAESLTNVRDTAVHYGLEFTKNVYFRNLNRFTFDMDIRDGVDLDRFSSYRLRSFQDVSVKGFDSTGLRFHEGTTGEMSYAFRIGSTRVDVSAGGGYFRNREDYGPDWQWAYGAGAGVTFTGPRGTLFRVRTTYGIDSSLPLDGASGSLRVMMFKTFDGWWPRKKRGAKDEADERDADEAADALSDEVTGG